MPTAQRARARALAESVSEMSLHEPPVDPPDPAAEARHALLDAFEEQDYEGRFRLFYEAIDGSDFLDSELAFEMLNHLSEGHCQTKILAVFQSPSGCWKPQVFCAVQRKPGITNSTYLALV